MLKRFLLTFIFLTLLTAPAWGADCWLYIRTYDRPEVKAGETGGRSKKGDIVQILDASIYKQPSETEKAEWLIVKVSGLTETQRNLMMKPWIDDTDKEKPITKAYRQYKLDLDILRENANIKIETGEFKTKLIPSVIIPLISQKTELDIARYKIQSYKYALIDKVLIIISNRIVPRAWATTTNTFTVIPAGGGDYATLSAWEDARDGNLVTSDFIEIANCSGATADTTAVTILGWTTNATHYIQINGDNTTGKASTANYRLSGITTASWAAVISVKAQYTIIKNIEVTNFNGPGDTGANGIDVGNGGEYSIIDGCIIHDNNTATQSSIAGIVLTGDNNPANVTIRNCLIYGFKGTYYVKYGIQIQYDYGNVVYNCTISSITVTNSYNCYGIYAQNLLGTAEPVAINNICYNTKTADFSGIFDDPSDYNFSEDDTAPEAAGHSIWGITDGKTPDFVNTGAGTEDFHLQSTSDAIDAGTDLYGSGVTTDIDNDTLTVRNDIGADEYVAAGGETYFPIWLYLDED